jgi:hypothetical protein
MCDLIAIFYLSIRFPIHSYMTYIIYNAYVKVTRLCEQIDVIVKKNYFFCEQT